MSMKMMVQWIMAKDETEGQRRQEEKKMRIKCNVGRIAEREREGEREIERESRTS